MIGVFYTSPAENSPPYVTTGQRIKKGDTVCIIESMKLMNEIVSDCDGVIEAVCAENNQVVDFDCVLFRVRKES
jgi:biotin carboxyl carrier protein